jgi:hypothetical protein
MHVLIGLLGSLVTILYLLDRLGIDIGGLNPFYLYRRYAFAKKYGADPIYSIEDPIHVASLLIIGAAKLGGDLTAEQRSVAQAQFEQNFSMTSGEASELFGSAAHLLAAPQLLEDQLAKLANKNSARFTREQTESLIGIMTTVVSTGGTLSPTQREFIDHLRANFGGPAKPEGTWN